MRKFLFAILPMVLTVLVLDGLAGCGGAKFTGTLCETCGTPEPPAGTPYITSVNPASVVAGDPTFTLAVTGKNFQPNTTVLWGGQDQSLATTYMSSTELTAQVPASLIANPGSISIIPSPVTTLNFGAALTITVPPLSGNTAFTVSSVSIQANDMALDLSSQQIYLSVASSNSTNADTIIALNPATGQFGVAQNAGGEPHHLAVSSDGSYLYAGIDENGTVQRFTLPSLGTDINIPLGSAVNIGSYYAIDVEAAPGSPHTVAILRNIDGGVVIYDDGVARPTTTSGTAMNAELMGAIQWGPNDTTLYGTDAYISGPNPNFYVLSVNASGVQVSSDYQDAGESLLHYDATTGYVYLDNGQVVNPSTGAVVGTFPLNSVQGGFSLDPVMVPDGTLNIAYFVGHTQEATNSNDYVLEAFDLTHFTLLGAVQISNVAGWPRKLIRWGANGLALLTNGGAGNPGGVYLISGAFVTSPTAQNRGTTQPRR